MVKDKSTSSNTKGSLPASGPSDVDTHSSGPVTATTPEPDAATYVEFLKIQWLDVHHSRNQDWELSKLVTAGALGIAGLKYFGEHTYLLKTATFSVAFLCLLALLITIRHRMLWKEKLVAIRNIEGKLNIPATDLFVVRNKGLLSWFKRHFHTQHFLILIYFVAMIFFIVLGSCIHDADVRQIAGSKDRTSRCDSTRTNWRIELPNV